MTGLVWIAVASIVLLIVASLATQLGLPASILNKADFAVVVAFWGYITSMTLLIFGAYTT